MIVFWHSFRLFTAIRVIELAKLNLFVCAPCTRGLVALARALVPEVYRNRDRGERVHRF